MVSDAPKPTEFDWRAFTPEDSPKTPLDVMADPVHQDLSTPKLAPGDPAFILGPDIADFSIRGEEGQQELVRVPTR